MASKKKEELLQPDVQTQAQPAAQSTYSTEGGWTAAPKWKRLWQTPATAPASR